MLLILQLNNLLEGEADVFPPVLLANIPNIAAPEDTGEHVYNLGAYFSGATSYAIDPAVETGWDFNTTTGVLTIDTDDTDSFGPYVITATNADGDTDSNSFTVSVTVVVAPVGGLSMGKFKALQKRYRYKD